MSESSTFESPLVRVEWIVTLSELLSSEAAAHLVETPRPFYERNFPVEAISHAEMLTPTYWRLGPRLREAVKICLRRTARVKGNRSTSSVDFARANSRSTSDCFNSPTDAFHCWCAVTESPRQWTLARSANSAFFLPEREVRSEAQSRRWLRFSEPAILIGTQSA